ncbi:MULTISPECIES: restriction endonuclease subunit S [unclassified Exiguobacterium]|uniref:restriction endonuclease subunit S n=1 Tax=unclassified Exiguobacterium TaxID=2644629 RepID=UPI001BE5A077|nr:MULTISPECIES: restriction endonuclease subunit S [unclassified Exiguobacterium]
MEFKELSKLAKITMGQSPKKEEVNISGKGLPLLNGPTEFGFNNPKPVQYTEYSKKIAPKGSLLFCVRGSTTGRMNWADQEYAIGRGIAAIVPIDSLMSSYLRNTIEYNLEYLLSSATGSTFPNVSSGLLGSLLVPIHKSTVRSSILLAEIQQKIIVNNEIIINLEQLAQTLFKRWFVDFEFPNENGDPYKSSGGEMVESELGMIPRNWSTGKLKDISSNFDKKRIPLSKLERLKRESIYPYYGAASLMDYVDDYLFDGVHLLIGEDGSVIDKDGFPILQYVWGKFWVNNHAHVLKGKEIFTEEYIYLLLKKTNVTNIVTGAVQPKINQTNLNNIRVVIPEREVLKLFNEFTSPIFKKIRIANDENSNLEKLRDTLLPRLLSGEIELPNETEVTEDVPIS